MTQGGAAGGPPTRHDAPRGGDNGFAAAQHTSSAGHGVPGPVSGAPMASAVWSPSGSPGSSAAGYPPPASPDAPTGSLPPVPSGLGASASAPAAAATESGRGRAARNRGPRRARLQLRHINPWTVLKFSCVLSIALFFVWLIVVGVLFGILDGAGIIGKINDTVTTIQGGNSKAPVTAGVVFGGAAIIGVINVVLFIALATIGSLIYNLCADLVGGIEITLSER